MSIAQEKKTDNSKIENFEDFVAEVFERKLAEGREIIRKTLSELDVQLMAVRDTKQYRDKGLRSTSIKTKLGTIEYERHICRDNQTGHYVYLLDDVIKASDIGLMGSDITTIAKDMIKDSSFRATAKMISESTGLSISHQAVWNIVQESGRREIKQTEELSERVENDSLHGSVETKLLYQEADGVWLKLQGECRKKHGSSKEMKVGIAYDGVLYQQQKGGKIRRILDNKVAFASFEPSKDFRRHHEAIIASVYNTDEIELRVKNGDGANWIQKTNDCECICVLDEFHRNKKLTECVTDKGKAQTLRELLLTNHINDLMDCLEAYINSSDNEQETAKLKELQSYYSENREALSGYYDRGIKIPETRQPGVIHHARLGSMESNVFTLIGNRMKGRRACWSINGANNLAALLCKAHSTAEPDLNALKKSALNELTHIKQSAGNTPKAEGKGRDYPVKGTISPKLPEIADIGKIKWFST